MENPTSTDTQSVLANFPSSAPSVPGAAKDPHVRCIWDLIGVNFQWSLVPQRGVQRPVEEIGGVL